MALLKPGNELPGYYQSSLWDEGADDGSFDFAQDRRRPPLQLQDTVAARLRLPVRRLLQERDLFVGEFDVRCFKTRAELLERIRADEGDCRE
jgi:hypothetical protein